MAKPITGSPKDALTINIGMDVLEALTLYCASSPFRLTNSQVVEVSIRTFLAAEAAKADPAALSKLYDSAEKEGKL